MRKVIKTAALIAAVAASASAQNAELGQLSAEGEGTVVAAKSWDISAEVSNQIKRIYFLEGQFVKEGDLLVEFDTMFKKLDVRLAKLALDRAKAELALAEEDLERKSKLSGSAVTETERRDAEIALEIAKANAEEAEILFLKAETLLQVQKIHAPFDGQVSKPLYRDNANLNTLEDTEIATLIQLDPIHVRVEGNYERLLERLAQGMTETEVLESVVLTLELPDSSAYPHQGKMITTSFGYDAETGTGYGIAEFPNPDMILRPGVKVRVTSYDAKN